MKLKAAILGATGMVGQKFIQLLQDHPYFEVSEVLASPRSAGKTYGEAVKGKWTEPTDIPEHVKGLTVKSVDDKNIKADIVFSALDSSIAYETEEAFASAGFKVVSNAKSHRFDEDVPMVIPEINSSHLHVLKKQQQARGWGGFIAVKPNCSLQSYMIALYPLHLKFGVKSAIVTTMQALSGSGYPGVPSLDIIDNIMPTIPGEEEKSEKEPKKIMGDVEEGKIVPKDAFPISAHCNRVPVIDGHLATVSVEFEKEPEREEIIQCWEEFYGEPQKLQTPLSPEKAVYYREEDDRPQPRKDRDTAKGMGIVAGRLRECNVLNYRFSCLSHNTIRGAAGGAVLIAEILYQKGYLS